MLAILIPVLDRPQNVKPLLDSIAAATVVTHRVLFVVDPDDQAEREAISREGGEMIAPGGSYASKIRAGVEATNEPLIMLGADDLRFRPGWFEAAHRRMEAGAAVVGLNDTLRRRHRREHATHFLMTREYACLPCLDGSPGPLCDAYAHCFVDDELIATAMARHAYVYAPDAVVEHRHFLNRAVPMDETYRLGQSRFDEDREIFRRRETLWN